MDIFNNIEGRPLDNNQIKAILSKSKNNLVVAGAGSGKTTTIVGKVKYLINNGYQADEILVLSFTNASASEMKERIYNETKEKLDVMTFHKLGFSILENKKDNLSILKENVSKIIFPVINILISNNEYLENLIMFIYKLKSNKRINEYKILFLNEKYLLYIFCNYISNFISLMKQNNHSISDLNNIKNKDFQLFLNLYKPIYEYYKSYLKKNNLIDFNDMINESINIIETNKIILSYKYIIIDEFQDISKNRYELINRIINQTSSSLFCVGDDFQCIFSFAGSEIDYFTNFGKYFGNYKLNIINKTYRFNKSLVDISSKFIMKNKNQIRKTIISNKKDSNNGLEIIEGNNSTEIVNKLYDILLTLPFHSTIYFLGRYKFDLDIIKLSNKFYIDYKYNLDIVMDKRVDLIIKFMTVHQSKGLQADYTIVLNNKNGKLGFPSKIIDDKFLKILKLAKEKFPYAEERRLFYVAITRSKIKTYLLNITNNESIFVKEIKKVIKITQ